MVSLLSFVLVLGVLVFVHELGHFVAAKAVGIAVPRFSIGLGPITPLRFKHRETEYVISWVPFGGYVKMASREEQEQMEALEGGAVEETFPPEKLYESKPLWARVLVMVAGVAMNVLFAWAAFSTLMIAYGQPKAQVGEVDEGQPAAAAGLMEGDLVVEVDGAPVLTWDEMVEVLSANPGRELTLGVERADRRLELTVVPAEEVVTDLLTGEVRRVGRIGIGQLPGAERRPSGLGEGLVQGARLTGDNAMTVLLVLKGIVTGQISIRELGGPIMIGQMSGRAARAGGAALLAWMAILSVNLAVLNLLPIPVLDGGHLVFLFLEGVRGGRPLPRRLRERLTMIGVYFLLALMVFVMINDSLRP